MVDNKKNEEEKYRENNDLINNNPRTEESKVSNKIDKEAKGEEEE